jgi:hypothetical protein
VLGSFSPNWGICGLRPKATFCPILPCHSRLHRARSREQNFPHESHISCPIRAASAPALPREPSQPCGWQTTYPARPGRSPTEDAGLAHRLGPGASADGLPYMHNNPAKRGLVSSAGGWPWSRRGGEVLFPARRISPPYGPAGLNCPLESVPSRHRRVEKPLAQNELVLKTKGIARTGSSL